MHPSHTYIYIYIDLWLALIEFREDIFFTEISSIIKRLERKQMETLNMVRFVPKTDQNVIGKRYIKV